MPESATVYDCFTFYNELDLLELRLNELNDIVDYFVLVEGTKTYQGDEKPLYYAKNKERFSEFNDRIIHVVVDEYPDSAESAWDREHHTRNAISRGIDGCSDEDIIMISDVDEIPCPDTAALEFQSDSISVLGLKFYYYFFNCQVKDLLFPGTVIGEYHKLSTPQETREIASEHVNLNKILPISFERYPFQLQSYLTSVWASLKLSTRIRVVPYAGWHFSYLSDVEGIIDKIETFSHTEYDREEYKDPDRIQTKLLSGEDLFDRDFTLEFVEVDQSFPTYLLNNRGSFGQYIME